MLEQLGITWLREGYELVVAQDTEGTGFWLIETASGRLAGPFGEFLGDAVREVYESFVPDPAEWQA